MTRIWEIVVCLFCFIPLFSCTGKRPSALGISDAGLAPCSSSPNCVSSGAPDGAHRVEAFALSVPPKYAWQVIREAVAALPRTTVVKESANYLHAECTSALFGFVDDLELHLRPSDNMVAIRSASRLGYSDLGVNRRRVE
jgi:uncharacterized protein (DUF1499 family)